MVGLGGLEPPTFPILSGRSSQRFDVCPAFHTLDFPLAPSGVAPGIKHFGVEQFPWPTVPDGGGSIVIVLEDALGQILRVADIKLAR
jgi:hypothetical protein